MSVNESTWQTSVAAVVILGVAVLIGYVLPHHEVVKSTSTQGTSAPPPTAKPVTAAVHGTVPTLAGFTPPAESAIPNNEFGKIVRLG